MGGLAELLSSVGDLFVQVGPEGIVFLAGVGVVVWTVIRGRFENNATATESLADAVQPISCAWNGAQNATLKQVADGQGETNERLERIERDLAILKDRRAP